MYAAVDVGGTKTLIAVFNNNGEIVEQLKFPTPTEYDTFKAELADSVVNLHTKQFISGAIGIRGNIDRKSGRQLFDDVLPWRKAPVRDDCAQLFGCDFALENDSKLAGLSEARLAGNLFHRVLYVTVSTGIGSAFIVDGELDEHTIDSEIGKSVYEHDGRLMQWEDFASGKAIVKKYGKRASEIEDPAAWHEIARNLAIGLINASAAYTPDLIILGGGVGTHYTKF
jgi:predicted NBD/HSP70 family sugar kinase